MSELRTNRIIPRDGLPSGSAGGIIQVKQTILKTAVEVIQSVGSGYADINGLSVTITPTRSDSKVLVECQIYNSNNNAVNFFRLLRGSTFIEEPSGTSSSGANYNAHGFSYFDHQFQDTCVFKILDSPNTTNAVTYTVTWASPNGTAWNTASNTRRIVIFEMAT